MMNTVSLFYSMFCFTGKQTDGKQSAKPARQGCTQHFTLSKHNKHAYSRFAREQFGK